MKHTYQFLGFFNEIVQLLRESCIAGIGLDLESIIVFSYYFFSLNRTTNAKAAPFVNGSNGEASRNQANNGRAAGY